MRVAIRVVKYFLVLIASGWAYLNISWYLFAVKASHLMQTTTGIPSAPANNTELGNIVTIVQASLTTLGPLIIAVIFLLIKWPESILVANNDGI